MNFDFNNAERQQNGFDLIPANTILPLVMCVRPGGSGERGWLRPSQSSDAMLLDCEFTVESGPYAKRKIWQMFTVSGGKLDEHGESIGARISRQSLRAILESARNIHPDDYSERGIEARRINDWDDFNDLVFWAKIGVEKDKTGQYGDKNKIACVITPDMKEYGKMTETAPTQSAPVQSTPHAQGWGASAPSVPAGGYQASQAAPSWKQKPVQPSETVPPVPAWAMG